MTRLYFYQDDGPSFFGPGNSYAIPGKLVFPLDFDLAADLFGGTLTFETSLPPNNFVIPYTLEGNLDFINVGPSGMDVAFAGISSVSVPLGQLSQRFFVNSFGVVANMSADFAGELVMNLDHHLQDSIMVPEAGTFILAIIGGAALAPMLWQRIRRRPSCKS